MPVDLVCLHGLNARLHGQYPQHHLTAAPRLVKIIHFSGYPHDKKLHIALRSLLPTQVSQNGLSEAHVKLTEHALSQAVMRYAQEAEEVRSLMHTIGGLVRYRVVEWIASVVNKQGPPSSSLPPHSPASSETSKVFVKRSKDADVGRRLRKRSN